MRRRRIKPRLDSRATRYRDALEASLDAFFSLQSVRDADGEIVDFRFVEMNSSAAIQLDQARETIIGTLLCERFPINRTNGFLEQYKQVMLTGEPLMQEYYVPEGYPAPGWYLQQVVRVGDGIAIFNRSITEQKQIEHELRQSDARFRLALWAASIVVAQVDTDLRYTWIYNPHNDFAPDAALGKRDDELANNDGIRELTALKQAVLTSGQTASAEITFPLSDGNLTYSVLAAPTRDGNGDIIGVTTGSIDITEQKRYRQREFELMLEKERVHLLGRFIEKASHEFRTPLTIINSSAGLMARTPELEKRQTRAAAIEKQVEILAHLVDKMLLLTRLRTSALVNPEPVNMVLVIADVCEMMRDIYRSGPSIDYQRPPNLPPVNGSYEELVEALSQIVDNACRYALVDDRVTVTAGASDRMVWVEVSDTGTGIDAADMPHIFETFWRRDKAHTTPGMGLGLPIAQRVLERHNSSINVTSVAGQGTTVRITLPVNSDSTPDGTG